MSRARFEIVRENAGGILIRDVGPWNIHPTVTNDAEGVVADLHHQGKLRPGMALEYLDSEGRCDQLLHDGAGTFKGFAPGAIGGAR